MMLEINLPNGVLYVASLVGPVYGVGVAPNCWVQSRMSV